MANEMVKYHNDLNAIIFDEWTEAEMNILFAAIAKVRDKSVMEVSFSVAELRELAQYRISNKATKLEFADTLFDIMAKLKQLSYTERSANGLSGSIVSIFRWIKIDENNEKMVRILVEDDFERIFNKLGIHFTAFELLEFVNIKSIYTKTIYRMLKQFRTQGWWQISLEDFRELLAIPDSYKSGNIDQQILNPTLKQLGGTDECAIFKNLDVEKLKKKGRGRGGVLTGYKFTFDKETTGMWIDDKFEKSEYKPKASKPVKRNTIREVIPESFLVPGTDTPLTPEESLALDLRIAKTQQSWKKGE